MDGQTYVLVHGAFHGGWCWSDVAAQLRREGHSVFAPSLTGLGDRSHLATAAVTLRTHILDIANLIKWEGLRDIVLCGHSYGGMVIAGVAEEVGAENISSIVFFDAILPKDGLALVDYPPPQNAEGKGFDPHLEDGLVYPPDAAAFGLELELRDYVARQVTPQPLGTFTEKLPLTGAYENVRKKTYVLCSGSNGLSYLSVCAEESRARPGWSVVELQCGHDAMIEKPASVARLLLEAV